MKRNEVRVALICVWWGGLVQKLNCWRRGLRQMVWIACCSWRVLMKKRTGFLRKDDRCGDGGWDEMKWDMLTINSKEDDGSENDGWGWFGLVRWWRSMIIKSVYMVFFFFFFSLRSSDMTLGIDQGTQSWMVIRTDGRDSSQCQNLNYAPPPFLLLIETEREWIPLCRKSYLKSFNFDSIHFYDQEHLVQRDLILR